MARRSATGVEAAAVAAAIARFEAEVGGDAAMPGPEVDPWQRAALVEGVEAKQAIQDPQGGAIWQS